jgi:hypothetical protein
MSAKADLVWLNGMELRELLEKFEAYLGENGMAVAPAIGGTYGHPYVIGCGGAALHATRTPWDVHILNVPLFSRLDWTIVREGIEWFRCAVYADKELPPFNKTCVRGGRVIRLVLNFDEEPNSWDLAQKPDEAARAVQKYHQIRKLCSVLGCDEVNGYSDSHFSGGTALTDDPDHIQKILRFAETGRNVLIVPMEEGRARRVGEHDWRKVIDK